MLPTSLPGGSPAGITAARPTSPRRREPASRGMRAASSGVRPSSSSSGTSAQPSGTNTTYFIARESYGRSASPSLPPVRRLRASIAVRRCAALAARRVQRQRRSVERGNLRPRRPRARTDRPRRRSPRPPSSTTDRPTRARGCAVAARAGRDRIREPGRDRVAEGSTGRPDACTSPSRADASAGSSNGQRVGDPALDLRDDSQHGQRARACSGSCSRPTASSLYVDYTDPATATPTSTSTRCTATSPTRHRAGACSSSTSRTPNHNGGEVSSGPTACSTSGSATAAAPAIRTTTGRTSTRSLGKILRIDPTRDRQRAVHACPADNPFVGRAGAYARDLDVRPAQPVALLVRPRRRATCGSATSARTSTKRSTTRRQGQAGINWGWSQREGTARVQGRAGRPGARDPIVETSHDDGWSAIVGGYVYRGHAIPGLHGVYLFGDNCRTRTSTGVVQRGGRVDRSSATSASPSTRSRHSARTRSGELYARRTRRHGLPVSPRELDLRAPNA